MPATLVAPIRIPAQQLIDEEYPNSKQDAPVAAFAEEVEESLGYKVPNAVQFKEGKTPMLLAMFQEHEFLLYRPREVMAYQRQQVEKSEKEANKKRVLRQRVAGSLLLLSWIVSLCILLTTSSQVDWDGEFSGRFVSAITLLVFLSIGLLFFVISLSDNKYSFKKAEWESRRFQRKGGTLNKVIPELTLKLMLEIREKIPEVEFELSELVVDRRRTYDPIVFAFVENEKEFKAPIAIWEEPGFHGKLIDANEGSLA